MNPDYSGRSALPDNLKNLFRKVAMTRPDKELIAEALLFSQGFPSASTLSKQLVDIYDKCSQNMSKQIHYDFGLRALKSTLTASGGLRRRRNLSTDEISSPFEQTVILEALFDSLLPRLIDEDSIIFRR